MIEKDGDTRKDYQPERDFIVTNIVKEIRYNKELIAEIDELRKLLPLTGYKLHTMPGIDLATEAQLISEIGDINRFPDSDKLARFMGRLLCNSALPEKAKTKGAGMATEH